MDSASQSRYRGAFIAPLIATAALGLSLIADEAIIRMHVHVNWPWWLNDLEHVGSAWANRILSPVALLIALLIHRPALRHLILALPAQALLTHLLKFAVGRVRPADASESLLFAPFSWIHDGWPSGHSSLAWTIVFAFALRGSRTTVLWIALALYICWARLHTHSHFPSDLVAGAMVGWIAALTTDQLFHRWIKAGELGQPPRRQRGPWRLTALWLAAVVAPMIAAMTIGRRAPTASDEAARGEITTLYEIYLGREPDVPGLSAYVSQRTAGLPLIAIGRDILDSDESRRRLADHTAPQRVGILYDLLLHRPPSPAELERDVALVTDLSRRRGRLTLLIMRLTWPESPS